MLDRVEFPAVDEPPFLRHHGRLLPFDWIADPLRIGDEKTVGPGCARVIGIEQGADRTAVELQAVGLRHSGQVKKRRHDVNRMGECVVDVLPVHPCGRPMKNEGRAMAAIVFAVFHPAHTGIEDLLAFAASGPIIGGEDEDCVGGEAEFEKQFAGPSDVVVNVGDHGVERGEVRLLPGVEIEIPLGSVKRTVRGVGRNIGEKRLSPGHTVADVAMRLREKHVRAETLRGHHPAVVEIVAVKIGVVPEVGDLAHAAAAMVIGFREPAVLRAVREVVAEVPFAEQAGGVAVVSEHLGQRELVFPQHIAGIDGVPDASAVGPPPGE